VLLLSCAVQKYIPSVIGFIQNSSEFLIILYGVEGVAFIATLIAVGNVAVSFWHFSAFSACVEPVLV
jgi:hypothetical protein